MNPDYFEDKYLKMHQWDLMRATQGMHAELSLNKLTEVRYPFLPHRTAGRVKPGEAERQQRKTRLRKATRAQADMLCKFMLFKKGKYMPGRMV